MRHRYYDRNGEPMTMKEWMNTIETRGEQKRVAETKVGPWRVSTVWLGLNHQYYEGPPLIFETMIFDETHKGIDHYCERYSTEAEAAEGHARAVAWAETHMPPANQWDEEHK